MEYQLRCVLPSGEALDVWFEGFADLADCLDGVAVCDWLPVASACREWSLVSRDGVEMAARRG